LPKYGGKGMYGVKVQEAVMRANEAFAGCTVHFVTAGLDEGGIILQKSIAVDYRDTPWQLGSRIFKEENRLLVEAVSLLKVNAKV
jgi:phosphoribosylglycinamide formyltransferase-1